MKTLLIFLLSVFSASAQLTNWSGILPDATLTPGVINTNLSITNIVSHGFVSNSDARHVTEAEKKAVFISYFGFVPLYRGKYEIDHLISLELGGANDIHNLWPQSYVSPVWNAHTKDRLENWMAKSVRDTYKTNGDAAALLKTYQFEISHNWTNAYIKYLGQPK